MYASTSPLPGSCRPAAIPRCARTGTAALLRPRPAGWPDGPVCADGPGQPDIRKARTALQKRGPQQQWCEQFGVEGIAADTGGIIQVAVPAQGIQSIGDQQIPFFLRGSLP